MIKISYVQPCGTRLDLRAEAGQSLMQVAVANNVPGIDADCGGQCACGTCHVYIEAPWQNELPAPSTDETEMLNFAVGVQPGSRLACQVKVDALHDGLVVRLPEGQH